MTIPTLTSQGHLTCDFCPARYDYTIVEDHPTLTAREQLRQAASRAGWKQTAAGLEVCPADAAGVAAILVPGWAALWTPETAVLVEEPAASAAIPAVAEGTAA